MSKKKDNVIQFPTKANVPDTITISFGDSDPVTYTLTQTGKIDFSGITEDTITVNVGEDFDWDDGMYSTGWHDFGDDNTITLSDVNLTTVTLTDDDVTKN